MAKSGQITGNRIGNTSGHRTSEKSKNLASFRRCFCIGSYIYILVLVSLISTNHPPHRGAYQATKRVTDFVASLPLARSGRIIITARSACSLSGLVHTSDSAYGGLGYPDHFRTVQQQILHQPYNQQKKSL